MDSSPASGGAEVGRERGGRFSSAKGRNLVIVDDGKTAYPLRQERRIAQSRYRRYLLQDIVAEPQGVPSKRGYSVPSGYIRE